MKIFVEGSNLFRRRTGIGQYTKGLLVELARFDSNNQYTVINIGKQQKDIPNDLPSQPLWSYKTISYLSSGILKGLLIATGLRWPCIDSFLSEKPDIFLFPSFLRWPLKSSPKSITFFYDLSYIACPQYVTTRTRLYLSRLMPRSLALSDHIITISQYAKQQLLEYYKVDPAKVSIISPAVEHELFCQIPASDTLPIISKYGLSPSYILYVGTLEPRKNIVGLLNAYAQLPAPIQQQHPLVLAGGKGWHDAAIYQRLKELAHLPIIRLGYVPDEELPALYNNAALFVYPSFYEGFGIPPLEAMACGVPVITSNSTSLPEVVGDAAILIDPQDNQQLAAAMLNVLSDNVLADQLKSRGLLQAQKFNWQQSAQQLMALFAI